MWPDVEISQIDFVTENSSLIRSFSDNQLKPQSPTERAGRTVARAHSCAALAMPTPLLSSPLLLHAQDELFLPCFLSSFSPIGVSLRLTVQDWGRSFLFFAPY